MIRGGHEAGLPAAAHAAAGRAVEKLAEDLEADSDTLAALLAVATTPPPGATAPRRRPRCPRCANADAAVLGERALDAGRRVAECPTSTSATLMSARQVCATSRGCMSSRRRVPPALRLSQSDPLMSATLLRQRAGASAVGAFGAALAESKAEVARGQTSTEARRARVRLVGARRNWLEHERL
jgi:hypothetical protein